MSKLTEFIWYEKYRPKNIKDLTLPKQYIKRFNGYIKEKNIPHLLLSGLQGSGKTTIAHIFLRNIPCVKLILNASSKDRGISTIKNEVASFAASLPPKGKIKIVFFDEADGLTPDAQGALKNTIEAYSKTCRFILTANHPDKIIGPLHSRCTEFTFTQLPKKKLTPLLMTILEKEGIEEVNPKEVRKIVDRHFPDIRTVINELQGACIDGTFNPNHVTGLKVNPKIIVDALKAGKLKTIRTLIAGQIDLVWLYKYVYDNVGDYSKGSQQKGDSVIILAEYIRDDAVVPDRHLNFAACMISLMDTNKIKLKFEE